MIKIHDKLWYVKGVGRDDLAYMSQYETGKDGEPLANIAKMQTTGRCWAGKREVEYKLKEGAKTQYDYERDEQGRNITIRDEYINGEEAIADNAPTKGFYIGSSVARWSTSNKLFRVHDPRGFAVEVPTDNIATLLHHTTVINGVVDCECVWGREGNNHILLPVNSEPYLKTLGQMDTLANKLIPIKDLKVGDVVKFFEDPTEYYYAGKLRGTWKVRGYRHSRSYFGGSQYSRDYSEWVEVQDEKWSHVFLIKSEYGKQKYRIETPAKPKIVEVLRNESRELDVSEIGWYCPTRVSNKTNWSDRWSSYESKLASIEEKK